jgi:excisionase family DNA binding protein
MNDVLLTPGDVARRCQVSTKTVLRAIQSGRLRASRLGQRGAYRVQAVDVDVWLESTAVRAPTLRQEAVPSLASLPATAPRGGRLAVHDDMGRRR